MSAWAEVAAGVRVHTSRCYAMNSLVAETDGHALLVDPGVLPSELDDIAARVTDITPRFDHVAVAFTHPHWDHVLGAPWFPGATTFAHSGFADVLEHELDHIVRRATEGLAAKGEKLPHAFVAFTPTLAARGTTRVELGGFEVVTYDTPGHSGCHLAYWLPAQGVLAAGDLLSDIEIPWLDGPPWVYRSSLKTLHWLFEQEDVRVLVPGHGPVAHGRKNGYQRLLRDMNYLVQLEERVGAAFKAGKSLEETSQALSSMDYLGKDTGNEEIAMQHVHAGNVGFAYAALTDSASPGGD
jgi:glyoxylase-like metal-dependent hydrolase (beta-lactamase superfamily II)